MITFISLTFPTRYFSNSKWQFIRVWTAAHHCTWKTTASWFPVLTLGGISILLTVIYSQYQDSDSTFMAIGLFQLPALESATLSQILSGTQWSVHCFRHVLKNVFVQPVHYGFSTLLTIKQSFLLIDWVKVLRPTQHKIGHFGDIFRSQSLAIVLKQLNLTQQKHTKTNKP